MTDLVEKKSNIGLLFDNIASHYDFLNHFLSLNIDKLWRKRSAKCISSKKDIILDVATGTCDLALEIIKQDKASNIIGIDLSKEMLQVGSRKVQEKGQSSRIKLAQEDCTQLSFTDEYFDAVTCGFGVRNFNNLDKGLSEMFRVLKPEGELVILEFSYPRNIIIKALYNFYFTCILPLIGKLISKHKSAYTYLPQSVKGFIWGEDFVQHLSKAGFKGCKYKPLSFGIATIYTAKK